nr:non-ribosomal peptide synthetase [uncultured bacterium]
MSELSSRIAALTPQQREALMARLRRDAPAQRLTESGIARHPQAAYPASSAQQRMWFLHKLNPSSAAYNGSTAWRITGALDLRALAQSLSEIVRRHEVLRTRFEDRGGTLFQVPAPAAPLELEVVDIQHVADDDGAVRRLLLERGDQPFDLSAGSLFRAAVFRLGPDRHVLLLTAHHVVSDGESIAPLTRELSLLYSALSSGREPRLAPLSIQYGDYAVWEQRRLAAGDLDPDLSYWRDQLRGAAPIDLAPRGRGASARGAGVERLSLGPELSRAVRGVSRDTNGTLFMVLLAAFDVLLYRLTGQADVAVGSPVANRGRAELEPLIGFFVNLLVFRARLSPTMRMAELLDQVRRGTLQAIEHQAVPFERLVEDLSPDRDPSEVPLAKVAFSLQTLTFDSLQLARLTVAHLDLHEEKTRFDLELHAWDKPGEIELVAVFDTAVLGSAEARGVLRQFVRVLEQVTGNTDIALDDITLLSPAEQDTIVHASIAPPRNYPQDATLGELFLRAAAAHPAAVAIEDGAKRWTYAEFAGRAASVAAALRDAGVQPGTCVGLWMERSADLIATLVGISLAGAAYVPLELAQPAERAAGALSDTQARILITDADSRATAPAGPWRVLVAGELFTGTAAPTAAPGVRSSDLAYVLYTSGSTGRPKGVAVPHRAVVRLVFETNYVTLGSNTVMAQVATTAFDAATFEVWGALLHGGRLVVVPKAVAVSPAALGTYLQRTGVNTMFLTTALVHQIGREAAGALAAVDMVLFGGEAVDPRWIAAIQRTGAPRRFVHVYGPTENTTFSTFHPVPPVQPTSDTIPIGRPIGHSSCFVLDGTGALSPTGVAGELYVGGDGLAIGYVGAPRLTAERFVPDPFSGSAGARLYRTGDIVRWVEPGAIEFIGRRDGQVKLRGFRIELGEIEAALAAAPAVGAGVVVVHGTGENGRLIGYLSWSPGAAGEISAVRQYLKDRLPA